MNSVETYKEIGLLIKLKKTEIIDVWLERMKAIVDGAENHSNSVLIDHLPQVLENLADVFTQQSLQDEKTNEALKKMSKGHGLQRATQTDFDLQQVLTEYSILRRVILEQINSAKFLTFETTQVLHHFIDKSNESAVLEYVNIRKAMDEMNAEIRERFISAMSHDLRTPLAAAKMSAQIILRQPETSEAVLRHIPRIVGHIDRIDRMIRDLLDASYIRSGKKLVLELIDGSLKEIIEETIYDLGTIYGPRFKVDCTSEFAGFWSADSIKRILENLCNNAVKYGDPEKDILIKVQSKGEKIELSINNKGAPIPPNELQKIFSAFERGSDVIASNKKGWGIGLTLTKGLVEAQGGEIRVETNSQDGTTFVITLGQKTTAG